MEQETKVCKTCGRELPITIFRIGRGGKRCSVCNDCSDERRRATRAKNRYTRVEEINIANF